MAFGDVVRMLDETKIVAIVTTRQNGEKTVTPIWATVVEGVPYVRSGSRERWWYRHAMSGRPVAFVDGDGSLAETDSAAALELPRVDVRLEKIDAADPEQPGISAEVARKYEGARAASIEAMLSDDAVRCTFRVVPAA